MATIIIFFTILGISTFLPIIILHLRSKEIQRQIEYSKKIREELEKERLKKKRPY
jgi:hypothetical protein